MKHPTTWQFRHIRDGKTIWESDWIENALTDEGEQHILNCYFSQSGTLPAAFYMGLINDAGIAETDTLSTMVGEPSGNGYARQLTTFPDASTDAGDYRTTSTTETFTASGGTIGPVTHSFITNVVSGTAGLFLIYVPLSATRTMLDGDSLQASVYAKLS